MATDERVKAKELSSRDRGQLGNWLFTGYGDREEKTPLAVSVPKLSGKGPKAGPPPSTISATIGSDAGAAAGPAPGPGKGPHNRSGSAEAKSYQARNRGNIGDIMGMAHEPAPAPQQPPSPTASRASTAFTEASEVHSAKSSPAKSSSSRSSGSEKASVVAASEVSDLPSPTESRADSVAASFAPSEAGDAPDGTASRPRSVAEEYAKRNKGTMSSTFGESAPKAPTTPRVKGTEAQAYANRNRGQLTSDQYCYGLQKGEPMVTSRPMSAKRQQDNMAGILGSAPCPRDSKDGPNVRSPRNAEARAYKDRNRGTMGDVLGSGQWEMPKKSLAHDSYN